VAGSSWDSIAIPAAAMERAAFLLGVQLAARTMQHHINNQLARLVTTAELVADDPRTPLDLQERARRARESALAVAVTLQRLEQIAAPRLDQQSPGLPLLEL
jgi:hypothetical protein